MRTTSGLHRVRRAAAGAVLAVTALLAGAGAVVAAPPPPPDTGDLCANVPDGYGGFTDIGATGNEDTIECLAFSGITTGATATTFEPRGTVSRAQMALFIARMLDLVVAIDRGASDLTPLPASGPDAFTDDGATSAETRAAIDRLAAAGVVRGTGGGRFDPTGLVSRAQMATFVNNAHAFVIDGPRLASSQDFFSDDEGLLPHEANINGIAAAGIAQGVTDTTFGPRGTISRSQMASFVVRYLAVLFEAGMIDDVLGPQAELVDIDVADTDRNGMLSPTDVVVIDFDGDVIATSAVTVADAGDGDRAILTDDTPRAGNESAATFDVSADGTQVVITVGTPLVVFDTAADPGDGVIDGAFVLTGSDGLFSDNDGDGELSIGDEAVVVDNDVDGAIPAAVGIVGTVTAFDNTADTYTFVPDSGAVPRMVTHDADDRFTLAGAATTVASFEAALSVGDRITLVDDTSATDDDRHQLVQGAATNVATGTVGNIDTSADTLQLVDPVSGSAIGNVRSYANDRHAVESTTATVAAFEADLNEGDEILVVAGSPTNEAFRLTNRTVTGTVTSQSTSSNHLRIGGLGDDPLTSQNADYDYVSGSATNTYRVDGASATLSQFEAALTVGDLLTYARDNGIQTFHLTNAVPVTGTVVAVDNASNRYTFVPDASALTVLVEHDATDTFTINGSGDDQGDFESALTVGDRIAFVDDPSTTDADRHGLTQGDPTDVVAGTVGNVDTGADTLRLVDPATGATIGAARTYAGDLYSVGNVTASVSTFEADVNEGDTIIVVERTSNEAYVLANQTITGTATVLDESNNLLRIGALGDNPTTGQDANYLYGTGSDQYRIAGQPTGLADFEAALQLGDTVTYARAGGTQVIGVLGVTGQATESLDTVADVFTMVVGANDRVIDYTSVDSFTVDGTPRHAAGFEAAFTAGDSIVYTYDNPDTAADEGALALTNADLAGNVRNIVVASHTYDVVNGAGGVLYDNLAYNASLDRRTPTYFVNGGSVSLAVFDQYLTAAAADASPDETIHLLPDGGDIEHRLATDEVVT
jgi:hypothetical protein